MRTQLPNGPTLTDYNVIVYGLKTNSWSRLQGISKQYYLSGVWGIFMAGALHWIAIKTLGSESCLLILDLGVKNYREVQMPKVENKNVNDMCIVRFEKSLSVLEYHHHVRIDVWVMNNYGVANSWCKLSTVGQPEVIRSFVSIRPMA
ncbi:F-box protein CPR1-like [Apium graveolens]|uniref:F-box protein CPR1-like n=1 Tax=Apium graveolens TaxID=4045 RepID=UPI003D7C052B